MNPHRRGPRPHAPSPSPGTATAVAWTVLVLLSAGLAGVAGCRKPVRPGGPGRSPGSRAAEQNDELLEHAMSTLDRLEDFDTREMLQRTVDRLDQWVGDQEPLDGWHLDPMAADLFATFAGFAEPVGDVAAELEEPRDLVALKDLVAEIEGLARAAAERAGQFDALARRRNLQDLQRFTDKLIRVGKMLDTSPDPQLQGLARDLHHMGQQLQLPGGKVEPQWLDRIAAALKGADKEEVRSVPGLTEVVLEIQDSAKMEDLRERNHLLGRLGQLVERCNGRAVRLEEIAKRRDLAEAKLVADTLSQAAAQVQAFVADWDMATLEAGVEKLAGVVEPLDRVAGRGDAKSLASLAPQLQDAAGHLGEMADSMQDQAAEHKLPALDHLAGYVRTLGQAASMLAGSLTGAADLSSKEEFAAALHQLAGGLEDLSARLEHLRRPLEYLGGAGELAFPNADGEALQEAVWLRDVALWAVGDQRETVPQAMRLFDWTVRNIQLEDGRPQLAPDMTVEVLPRPWETLLLGRGTAIDRAWAFVLLARQQGIDAVLLALDDPEDPDAGPLRPWAVGVLDQGDMYVFDTALGLPIPAADGLSLAEGGGLEIRPATLGRIAEDPSLLRNLDLDENSRYPVEAGEAARVIALVEASPPYLTQRMALVQSKLTGENRMVLAADPTAQAERLRQCPQVARVELWALPYDTLVQQAELGSDRARWQIMSMLPLQIPFDGFPALSKGRLLHLKGRFTGDEQTPGATVLYQKARLSNRRIEAAPLPDDFKALYRQAKLNASFWMGLLAAERENPRAAIDFFRTRTLEVAPDGPWTAAAKYNLARAYEADGQTGRAIDTYLSTAGLPGYHGNLLRARWLASLTEPAKGPAAEPAPGEEHLPGLMPEEPELPGLRENGENEGNGENGKGGGEVGDDSGGAP